jgi:hypothetical protein
MMPWQDSGRKKVAPMISPLNSLGSGHIQNLASSVAGSNKNTSAINRKSDNDSDDWKASSTVGNSGSAKKSMSQQLLDVKA